MLLHLLTPTITSAQYIATLSVTERIRYLMRFNYKPNNSALSDSCINTIIIIKFKIIGRQIDSLDFSADSPESVKIALQNAVSTTNKQLDLKSIETKKYNMRTILLPVIINYQSGCTPSVVSTLETMGKNLNKPTITDKLITMLKFEKGGNYPMLDCIIINPIFFGNYF